MFNYSPFNSSQKVLIVLMGLSISSISFAANDHKKLVLSPSSSAGLSSNWVHERPEWDQTMHGLVEEYLQTKGNDERATTLERAANMSGYNRREKDVRDMKALLKGCAVAVPGLAVGGPVGFGIVCAGLLVGVSSCDDFALDRALEPFRAELQRRQGLTDGQSYKITVRWLLDYRRLNPTQQTPDQLGPGS